MLKWIFNTIVLLLYLLAHSSWAATATTTFQVTAFVNATCTISSSPLAFSPPSYSSAVNLDATSTLTVNCTNLAPYSIAMGQGNNFSGGTNRMLNGASNFLNYTLYQDVARTTTPWTGTGSTPLTNQQGSGANQIINVYGRVPSGQASAPTGAYTDSVIATITY